ncbi:MAG: EAL domain-containing protein [Sulfuricurvum sp.]|nr:EAL domain-containing protein [Sulfuricurvum sp.]
MNDIQSVKKNISFVAVAVFLTTLYFLIRDSSWLGSAHLHTVMETIATMLALGIGIGGLTRFYAKPDEKLFLFIGAGFLGTAFLDGYHAFVTSEHFSIFFPSPPESLIPWSWIASRLFLSIFMLFAYINWYKQYPFSQSPKIIYIVSSVTALTFFLFFIFIPLPKAYYDDYFFHRPEEFLPALFFALSLYGFYTKGGWKESDIEYWLILSLIVNLITQSVFMPLSTHLFDSQFDMAHLLKKISYIAVLTGIYVNMTRSFRNESHAVEEITEAKQEFETMFHISKDPIAILDMESNFLDFNDAYLEMTGFSREELLTKSCIGLSAPEDIERSIEALKVVFEKGSIINYEKTCIGKNNKRIIINMAVSLMPDKQRILISLKDITESKNYERQLAHIAHYDPLTGLPNRVLNADRLRQAMLQAQRRNEQIAILYLDLDGFKEVNDTYGHSTGDQLLIALASHMKQALRESDTLSRLGGDEFVAILTDLHEHSIAFPIIERLQKAASMEIQIDDLFLQVSASIGGTFYPQYDPVDADQLIRQADQAMYEAKQSGKNRYHIFNPEYDRIIRATHVKLERIEQALKNREFVLYYQPKINMRTGDLIGAEALIRWQHPEDGLISPLEFLPIIEDHPLAIEVGEWVIDEAITQIERWQQQGLSLPISVNVGAKQLLQANFVQRLHVILARHQHFNPSLLEIEVLETSALEDINQASKVIRECKEIGIHFALDDFGTGYSSLTYLKKLPIRILKIDQSFVRDMLDNRDDLAILAGIIGLAKAFERDVIAEGVETHEHGKQLLLLGCDLAQGYGISRPMPADILVEWSQRWNQNQLWTA